MQHLTSLSTLLLTAASHHRLSLTQIEQQHNKLKNKQDDTSQH